MIFKYNFGREKFTETQLQQGLFENESWACEYIYEMCYNGIHKNLINKGCKTHDVEDYFQDALISLISKIQKKEFLNKSICGYLNNAVYYLFLKLSRKSNIETNIDQDSFDKISGQAESDDEIYDLSLKLKIIEECSKSLSSNQLDFYKIFLEGLEVVKEKKDKIRLGFSNSEIAKKLNRTEQHIGKEKFDTFNKLRNCFKKAYNNGNKRI